MAKATNAAVMNNFRKPAMSHGATVSGRSTAKSMTAAVVGEFDKTLVITTGPSPSLALLPAVLECRDFRTRRSQKHQKLNK